jgi:sugar transferase (PEP-CTERM/EpsH1 system associated)
MRVLFLTHRLPYAPNRGDRIRAQYILRTLSAHFDVHLASLVHDDEEARHAASLHGLVRTTTVARVPWLRNRIRAARILVTSPGTPLTLVLLDSPHLQDRFETLIERIRPDVILASCSSMARFAVEGTLKDIPLVLDLIDVDSAKWAALAAQGGWRSLIYAREARSLRNFELRAIAHATATCVVNERERAILWDAGVTTGVHVIPIGIDPDYLRHPGDRAQNLSVIFSGMMNYAPNAEAAEWMVTEIWPLVLMKVPDAQLVIAGAQPTRRLRRKAARAANITVTGSVPDIRPYLWSASVSVAPLMVARGVQTKVIEAVASGLPVVVTPAVAGGLPPQITPACVTADTPEQFARAIVDLLALSPQQRLELASRADIAGFHFETVLEPLVELVRQAAARNPKTARFT